MTQETSKSSSKLIFCITAYNAATTLPKCLNSIKRYADRIVVVEGRFKGKPFNTKNSTDNTVSIAEKYGCEVIVSGDLPQHEQRDLYLVGEEGDVYFVIDADMVLEGEFDKDALLESDGDVWGVNRVDVDGRRELWLWIRRHIGNKPHHNVGQLLVDGYGRLMDDTYPNYVHAEKFWLRHIKNER